MTPLRIQSSSNLRGGFVPPHLKTEEFYRECARRISDRGVFISNLHATSELFYSDIKTIQAVFPQVVLFATRDRGNVIAVAVKYRTPVITDPAAWPATDKVTRPAFAIPQRSRRLATAGT